MLIATFTFDGRSRDPKARSACADPPVMRNAGLQHAAVHAMAPDRFALVLSRGEYEALLDLVGHAVPELHGRVVWNVNSAAKGGGVVEMLRPLIGYCRGAGVDARVGRDPGRPRILRDHQVPA
jgi:hypothetical protein